MIILRFIPMLLAICAVLNSVFAYFDIDVYILSIIGGISVLSLFFIIMASFLFKFCIYHRLPLYYIMICAIINSIDSTIGIPISDLKYMKLNIILFGIMLILVILNKYKICKSKSF